MTNTLAFPYYRWSDSTQESGDTLRRQSDAAVTYAAEHNLVLAPPITVPGISAHKGRHRQFGALAAFLQRLENGEIPEGSLLLVDSFDRLSREMLMAALHLLTGITTKGVVVVTLNDKLRYDRQSNMLHMMYALMQFARSHEESAEKGRKVRLAIDQAKVAAREERKPWTRSAPFWLDIGPDGQFCEKGGNYALVQDIFNWKEQGLGNASIARILNRKGVDTPRPRKPKDGEAPRKPPAWSGAGVGLLVTSRTVIGEYQPHRSTGIDNKREPDGEAIPNFYPEVIKRAQFDRVQAIIAGRRTAKSRPGTRVFNSLLVGMTTCERCGGPAGYWQQTRPSKPHLPALGVIRCNRFNSGACDNSTRIKYPLLEAELLPFIAGLPSPEVDNTAATALAEALGRRADLQRGIENVMDMLEKIGGDQPDMLSRLTQRRAEADTLDRDIKGLEAAAIQERGAVPPLDWRAAMADLIARMADADAEALYAIRAQINVMLGQVVRGGFVLADGHIKARFKPERADGKPLFYWGATGSLIRWQTDADMPSYEQMGVETPPFTVSV